MSAAVDASAAADSAVSLTTDAAEHASTASPLPGASSGPIVENAFVQEWNVVHAGYDPSQQPWVALPIETHTKAKSSGEYLGAAWQIICSHATTNAYAVLENSTDPHEVPRQAAPYTYLYRTDRASPSAGRLSKGKRSRTEDKIEIKQNGGFHLAWISWDSNGRRIGLQVSFCPSLP